jgi:hypothetical protein
MDRRVAGDNFGVLDADVPPLPIGDPSAGFSNQQDSSGDVPSRKSLFPESVEPPRGDICQINGRGTRAADPAGRRRDRGKLALVVLQPGEIAKGKAGSDQRELRLRNAGDVEALSVEPGAPTARSIIRLPHRDVVHYRRLEHAVNRRGDRHRETRITVQKVGGTVQRVYHPDEAAGLQRRAQLFSDNSPTGTALVSTSEIMCSAVRSTSVT